MGQHHTSIGTSTAVFGAIGLLAATQLMLDRARQGSGEAPHLLHLVAPLVGGLALLGALGASPRSDLGAPAFRLLGGAAIGVIAGLSLRSGPRRAAPVVQVALGATAAGARPRRVADRAHHLSARAAASSPARARSITWARPQSTGQIPTVPPTQVQVAVLIDAEHPPREAATRLSTARLEARPARAGTSPHLGLHPVPVGHRESAQLVRDLLLEQPARALPSGIAAMSSRRDIHLHPGAAKENSSLST